MATSSISPSKTTVCDPLCPSAPSNRTQIKTHLGPNHRTCAIQIHHTSSQPDQTSSTSQIPVTQSSITKLRHHLPSLHSHHKPTAYHPISVHDHLTNPPLQSWPVTTSQPRFTDLLTQSLLFLTYTSSAPIQAFQAHLTQTQICQ
ncbi:hypothetical protein M0R45_020242 [Rubus argutus]|uniref:Uncharacterized protein n=1 Tax=Rubus argutus TaxID=59490 RepID=A0AAW1XA57_RUBAR